MQKIQRDKTPVKFYEMLLKVIGPVAKKIHISQLTIFQ